MTKKQLISKIKELTKGFSQFNFEQDTFSKKPVHYQDENLKILISGVNSENIFCEYNSLNGVVLEDYISYENLSKENLKIILEEIKLAQNILK